MAMSVDVVLPTAVCERVAREVGGLVAPTIPYGYKSQPRSGGGEAFPGTTSLDAHTFSLVVRDVIRSLGHDGVRRLVVLNGHFENCWPAVEGVDLGLRELRRDGIADMQVMRLEYWDFVHRQTLDRLFPDGFPGTELEHASLLETSLMLLLRPDLVDMSQGAGRRPGQVSDLRPPSGARRIRAGFGRAGPRGAGHGRLRPMADGRPCRAHQPGGAHRVRL